MSNKKRWLAMKCQKQDDKNLMISGIAEPLMAGQGGSAQLLFMSSPEKAVKLRDRFSDIFPTFFLIRARQFLFQPQPTGTKICTEEGLLKS